MAHMSVSHQILELLKEQHLLTAPQLLEKIHTSGKNVNKTTVYRALDKLLAEGSICKQNLQDNELVYELRDHHHDHLVCNNCKKILVAECQVHLAPQLQDFQVDHHHLTVFGTCAECANSDTTSTPQVG